MKPPSPTLFFGLIFGASLPLYGLGILEPQLGRWMPLGLPISAVMFVIPALVALGLAYWQFGKAGTRRLLCRLWEVPRTKWLWISVGVMPLAMLISYGLQIWMGQTLPQADWQLSALVFAFLLYFFGAIGEELGWMGYAIDPLEQRYGFWVASIGLGVVWWLWHVIPYHTMGYTADWILWQGLATVLFRLGMVWIYNQSGHNVLTSVLFHTMINTSIAALPLNGSSYSPMVTSLVLLGMGIFVLTRRKVIRFLQ